MHVLHVVGRTPNFMKVAPVLQALQQHPGVAQTLVHTGQHYDVNMSDIFFQQLGIPRRMSIWTLAPVRMPSRRPRS